MTLHGLRRVGASVAVMTMIGAGLIATGGTANAAESACPNNSVCVWGETDFYGPVEFAEDASTMHDNPNQYYSSPYLQLYHYGFSTANTSLGRFCTYNSAEQLTNILNAQTSGNISNDNVYYIKAC
jgi:hypothetical protein